MSTPKLESLTVIIRGKHDTGKTTLANFLKMLLQENGYQDITIKDAKSLPHDKKDDFIARFARNRTRPVEISVELVE
jgi:Flp pilus assembly CpaF family ATPase